MSIVWAFLSRVPSKIWGWICAAAGVLILLWSLFQFGKSKAKTEAKVTELRKTATEAVAITDEIVADVVAHKKIEEEVNALPVDEVRVRADRWVRKPKGAGGSGSD